MSSTSVTITTHIPVEVSGLSAPEQQLLSDIMSDVKRGVDAIRRAAGRWMELSEKARGRIVEQTRPSLRDFWGRLEAVGTGALHPQLATVSSLAGRYLGKLGLEEQELYLREGIEVVTVAGRRHDVRRVDVVLMSEEQRKLVFRTAGNGTVSVRTVEEQKALLADQAAKRVLAAEAAAGLKSVDRVGWAVTGGRVFVKPERVKLGLTKKDLQTMLGDLGS